MFMFTGCYDANEIDDLDYILTLGIDKGATDAWRITIQYPSSESSGGAGKGSNSGSSPSGMIFYETLTIDVPDFFTGLNMINSVISRKLSCVHTKYVIFSEDVARSGDIGEFLSFLVRYRQIRRITNVIVSKGSAMDFIKADKPIGATLSKAMEAMLTEADNTGFFPHVTLNNLYDDIKSTYHQTIVPLGAVNNFSNLKPDKSINGNVTKQEGTYYAGQLPRQGGNNIELFGCAVFDGDKMVGELNGEENRFMLMASGKFKNGFFTMQDPKSSKYTISFDVRPYKKPHVKISINADKPIIHLKVELEGDILAIQSRIYYESPELMPLLEKIFSQKIKSGIDNTINKCKSLKTDVFNFGDVAAMQFGTIQEWEKYNWLKKFENSEVITEVSFKIKRTGKMLKSTTEISTEGNG